MAGKRRLEDIIGNLRKAAIVLARGGTAANACHHNKLALIIFVAAPLTSSRRFE